MLRIDRIKEELGWLKVVLGILSVLDASLVAWLAQNFQSAQPVLLLTGLVVVALLTTGIVWVNRLAYLRLEQLEVL